MEYNLGFDLPILQIRNIIEIGLGDYLGFYKFPSGQKVPAFAVLENYDQPYPPPGTEISGLEAVLMFPQVKPMWALGGHNIKFIWYLFLKQWDFDQSTVFAIQSLVSAINKVNYLDIENIFTNPSNQSRNQPEITRIELSSYRYVA